MRVCWVGPLSTRSAVARIAEVMAPELARRCDLTIVHAADEDPRPVPVPTVAVSEAHEAVPLAAHADLAVYSIGDSSAFHRLPFEVSQRVPGVVVLADGVLQHLFADLALRTADPMKSYLDMAERSGGPALVDQAMHLLSQVWLADFGSRPDLVDTVPLLEPALCSALGVIVASHHGRERVEEVFHGPVAVVSHPCALDGVTLPEPLPREDSRLLVISTGHVNPNRHVDVTIEAIAADPVLRAGVRLVVAGPMSPWVAADLRARVDHHGLHDVVEFRGRVTDDEMLALMVSADAAVNLRWPVMETGSASLVEQLWCGAAVVVLDAGHYAEFPDDTVLKVRSLDAEAVGAALRTLLADPTRRARLAAEGAAYVRAHHTAARYAADVAAFLHRAASGAPVLRGVDRIGARLGAVFGRLDPDDLHLEGRALTELLAHLDTLLGSPGIVGPAGELTRPVTPPPGTAG